MSSSTFFDNDLTEQRNVNAGEFRDVMELETVCVNINYTMLKFIVILHHQLIADKFSQQRI